jgi:hypothetical protein
MKEMKMLVELNDEAVSELVVTELRNYKDGLEHDLEKVTRTQQGFVYDMDWLEDSRLIAAKIAAIILILEDYEC